VNFNRALLHNDAAALRLEAESPAVAAASHAQRYLSSEKSSDPRLFTLRLFMGF